jgi:hypothetical protein
MQINSFYIFYNLACILGEHSSDYAIRFDVVLYVLCMDFNVHTRKGVLPDK